MNHKNLDFTQIPDKTNDVIFLKSSKIMFFWPFLPDGDFSKKSGSVTHNYIWTPNTMLSFKKDGWKDVQTLFYETLPAKARGPKKKKKRSFSSK